MHALLLSLPVGTQRGGILASQYGKAMRLGPGVGITGSRQRQTGLRALRLLALNVLCQRLPPRSQFVPCGLQPVMFRLQPGQRGELTAPAAQ